VSAGLPRFQHTQVKDHYGLACADPTDAKTCPKARLCKSEELCHVDWPDWTDDDLLDARWGIDVADCARHATHWRRATCHQVPSALAACPARVAHTSYTACPALHAWLTPHTPLLRLVVVAAQTSTRPTSTTSAGRT
tara:strand:- start:1101 stop:1511 length:411 start_codon:yes stop_codon:yes gene_type:complete